MLPTVPPQVVCTLTTFGRDSKLFVALTQFIKTQNFNEVVQHKELGQPTHNNQSKVDA